MKKEYREAIARVNNVLQQLPQICPNNNADFGMKALASSSLERVVSPAQQALFAILMHEKENIKLDELTYELIENSEEELKYIIGEWIYKCETHPNNRDTMSREYFLELFQKSSHSKNIP